MLAISCLRGKHMQIHMRQKSLCAMSRAVSPSRVALCWLDWPDWDSFDFARPLQERRSVWWDDDVSCPPIRRRNRHHCSRDGPLLRSPPLEKAQHLSWWHIRQKKRPWCHSAADAPARVGGRPVHRTRRIRAIGSSLVVYGAPSYQAHSTLDRPSRKDLLPRPLTSRREMSRTTSRPLERSLRSPDADRNPVAGRRLRAVSW